MLRRIVLSLLLLSAGTSFAAAQDAPAAAFQKLLDEAWETRLKENPLFATGAGEHRYNDRLPRQTIADQLRRLHSKRKMSFWYGARSKREILRYHSSKIF